MTSVEKYITKIKKKLSSDDIEERKIIKYLRHLDELEVNLQILKNTGIGKIINGLKKQDGRVGEAAGNLVLKWKNALTKQQELQDDEQCNTPTKLSLLNSETSEGTSGGNLQNRMHGMEEDAQDKQDQHKVKNTNNVKPKDKAPSLQLCDISFGCELPNKGITKQKKKHKHNTASSSSKTSQDSGFGSNHLNSSTSNSYLPPLPTAESVNRALLPDIQPTYRPSRIPCLEDSPSKRRRGAGIEGTYVGEIKSKKSRTQVFSGRKHQSHSGVVASLFDSCIRVLTDNIEALHETGGVPYYILHPVLVKCTPQQLLHLESYNPEYIEESDELWMTHYRREFKTDKHGEDLSWRESYLAKCDEREEKLAKINAKISASQAAKKPERQVKLAYVETVAKPPPQIRRKQAKYGTGDIPIISPVKQPMRTPHSRSSHVAAVAVPTHTSSAPPSRRLGSAPLLKKTMKLVKNQRTIAGSSIRRR